MSSWGKDSVVLVDLACEAWVTPSVLYLRSPASLPGVDAVIAAHRSGLDYHEIQRANSLTAYIEWVRSVGLPHDRTPSEHAQAVASIKSDPAEAWMQEYGYDVLVLGMRADEGNKRTWTLGKRGPIYQRAGGRWVANPLAWWSARDVWAHIAHRGLVYHRQLYDAETHGRTRETLRNTGWLSTDGAARGDVIWLRHHFPEQYRLLATEFPEIRTYA